LRPLPSFTTLLSYWSCQRTAKAGPSRLEFMLSRQSGTMNVHSVKSVLAGQAPAVGPVTVRGWVRTRRDSKAGLSFVHVSDGSSFHPLQVVAPSALVNYVTEVQRLTAGCSVEATGTIVPSPAKGQPFEMQATEVRVVGWVDDPDTYPIQPKPHTLEFLREVAHLRPPHQRDRRVRARAARVGAGDPPLLPRRWVPLGQHADHYSIGHRRRR
jgi:hypothetical protein